MPNRNGMTKNQFLTASEALYDAIEKLGGDEGGTTALAQLCGVRRQTVSGWRYCPTPHVRVVEKETGISRKRLRPDVYGGE